MSGFYCFCEKYDSCELGHNHGRTLCPLCKIRIYLCGHKEELDGNQFNLFALKQFSFKLVSLLMECYHIKQRSLEAITGYFCYSSRYQYTDQKSGTPLKKQIKFTTKIKEENYKKSILTF